MSSRKIIKYILLILILSTACSKPQNSPILGEVFLEKKLKNDKFAITYRGNVFSSEKTVKEHAMQKAAEVTVDNGYKYFTVLMDRKITREERVNPSMYSSVNKSNLQNAKVAKVLNLQGKGSRIIIKCSLEKDNDDYIEASSLLN
jgi:hypothetical protein